MPRVIFGNITIPVHNLVIFTGKHMEITPEMTCPTPTCQSVMTVWQFDDPPITVASCTQCELDGVLGDDRLLSSKGLADLELKARLRKRAERVAEWKAEAGKRFTEVK